jgi:hypothetical protein
MFAIVLPLWGLTAAIVASIMGINLVVTAITKDGDA